MYCVNVYKQRNLQTADGHVLLGGVGWAPTCFDRRHGDNRVTTFTFLWTVKSNSFLQIASSNKLSAIVLEFVGCCVNSVSDCWSRCEDVFLYVKVYSCVSIRE